MNSGAKRLPLVALALIPFLVLFGAWIWKQPSVTGGVTSASRPSVSVTAASTSAETSTSTQGLSAVQRAAESVLGLYLSNPSPQTEAALQSLRPLVSEQLFDKISREWNGAHTKAEPRVDEIRATKLTPLSNGMGVRYEAEIVQIVKFPAGQDEINTLTVSLRLKQREGQWIVHDLKVL